MSEFPYKYSINEEITRWAFEVYVEQKITDDQCWIAFTNPTAGPWKKIAALNTEGKLEEIYRFSREEDRPDLVLACDVLQQIVIIEAKDNASKLINEIQMKKSITVIDDMGRILKEIQRPTWTARKDYNILPSFLWYSDDQKSALAENQQINGYYQEISKQINRPTELVKPLVNIVIIKKNEVLTPIFIQNNAITENFLETVLKPHVVTKFPSPERKNHRSTKEY